MKALFTIKLFCLIVLMSVFSQSPAFAHSGAWLRCYSDVTKCEYQCGVEDYRACRPLTRGCGPTALVVNYSRIWTTQKGWIVLFGDAPDMLCKLIGNLPPPNDRDPVADEYHRHFGR